MVRDTLKAFIFLNGIVLGFGAFILVLKAIAENFGPAVVIALGVEGALFFVAYACTSVSPEDIF